MGQADVPRGSSVQFTCRQQHVLTQGQLTLACDDDGKLIGQLPVCLGEALTVSMPGRGSQSLQASAMELQGSGGDFFYYYSGSSHK